MKATGEPVLGKCKVVAIQPVEWYHESNRLCTWASFRQIKVEGIQSVEWYHESNELCTQASFGQIKGVVTIQSVE